MRPRAILALALLGAACSGSGDETSSSGSASARDGETSTTEVAIDLEVPSSFRATGEVDGAPVRLELRATVAGPDRYRYQVDIGGYGEERVRSADRLFTRSLLDGDEQFVEAAPDEATVLGQVRTAIEDAPDTFDGVGSAELVMSYVVELLLTEPAALLDLEGVHPDEDLDLDLPQDAADLFEEAGIDLPALGAELDVVEGELNAVQVTIEDDEVSLVIEVTYDDVGDVDDEDVAVPSPEEIDPTPHVDEGGLATYAETPLLLPSAPLDGLVLTRAVVLDELASREGCEQLQLEFGPPGEDGADLHVFLIARRCMEAFDDTAFDEVAASLPARFDGLEILVGDTVVQFGAAPPGFDTGAFAASLVPVTPEQLIAAVAPAPE